MADSIPGISAITETEEVQIFGRGHDNYGARYDRKVQIKSTVVDSGNTPTTTLRGGFILGKKTSDGLAYKYDPTANDGTQIPVGVLPRHMSMLDRNGTAENKFKALAAGGLLSYPSNDLINRDYMSDAVLYRSGFVDMTGPNGSCFLMQPLGRYYKTADYTLVAADHGLLFIASTNAVNFTLPSLAAVSPGWTVWLFNAPNANMVVTAPVADTIVYDDTTNGLATTLTWSTASQKMGASVMMRADYNVSGTMNWFPFQIQRAVTAA